MSGQGVGGWKGPETTGEDYAGRSAGEDPYVRGLPPTSAVHATSNKFQPFEFYIPPYFVKLLNEDQQRTLGRIEIQAARKIALVIADAYEHILALSDRDNDQP